MKADHARWLDAQDRKSLALGAADCAERVLTQFEKQNRTCDRPRKAIEAAHNAKAKAAARRSRCGAAVARATDVIRSTDQRRQHESRSIKDQDTGDD